VSKENVEIMRRAVEAYNRGDLDAAVADVGADVEFMPSGALPGQTETVQGREGYKRFLGWVADEFSDAHAEAAEIRDAGDRVLLELTLSGRGRQSGVPASWTLWQVWTLEEGKFVQGRAFSSKDQALKAAGL
jgi:ketosteroid isomerase-like protein